MNSNNVSCTDQVEDLLREVAVSGVAELHRKYAVVQIDRETWDAIKAWKVLNAAGQSSERGNAAPDGAGSVPAALYVWLVPSEHMLDQPGSWRIEKRTCLVRDLKNPKGKGYHGVFPLLGRAWDIVMAQPRLTDKPSERIFPFNPKTCSARYTLAKAALGITGLRLHDSRRHKFSGMLEQGYSVAQVQQVSLHTNANILLGSYVTTDPASVHNGPAAMR